MSANNIYNIPAGFSFVDVLAKGVMELSDHDPLSLAQMQILLPTRRGCRSLREAFLRITHGKPLLLPRMNPIGDVDEEELDIFLGADISQDVLNLPPSMPKMMRQFLLAKLIGARGHGRGISQDLELAKALSTLMDQTYTQDLDLKDLPSLVDEAAFADHWQVSIKFLSIISEFWPQILKDHGKIDSADRRNRLLKSLANYWDKNPPQTPVIAAGSTGSIPATCALLKTISMMPKGMIILPGLDQAMDEKSWDVMDDSHPQATLKALLKELDAPKDSIKIWPVCEKNKNDKKDIRAFVSEIMRPPQTADEWQSAKERLNIDITKFPIERYDCANLQEEALVIALALRQSLENPSQTAALVTPDRQLARRVALTCKRWGIEIDDSAGQPYTDTRVGTYLTLLMECVCDDIKPVSLLDFCKHALCTPQGYDHWRSDIRTLDQYLLRGAMFEGGTKGYEKKLFALDTMVKKYPDKKHIAKKCHDIVMAIQEKFHPLIALSQKNALYSLSTWIKAHIECAENFCPKEILWAGQDGEALSSFLSELERDGIHIGDINAHEYLMIITSLMKPLSLRPKFGLHPRLMILGQLEARLLEPDVMILSGLNEGTWPQKPSVDPWMSRPMRQKFGLPSQERSIGLSSHDFSQSLCANKVVITRSLRVDGTPTIPSRWLMRMDTLIEALKCPKDIFTQKGMLLHIARMIDKPDKIIPPLTRPEPRPPQPVRPRKLSVTKIEHWINDPYSIYARYILKLNPLKDLEQDLDAAIRGSIIHDALLRFYTKYKRQTPQNFVHELMKEISQEIDIVGVESHTRALWWPRLEKMAAWLMIHDAQMRHYFSPYILEEGGEMIVESSGQDFTILCRADRIDISHDGKYAAIIDYKSGGSFSAKGMGNGTYPQLPLEGLILLNGGFKDKKPLPASMMAYWVLNGSKDGGDVKQLDDEEKIMAAIENARDGLVRLIEKFDDEATPYYSLPRLDKAPRFNDYEHLARIKEWTALDDVEFENEDAA